MTAATRTIDYTFDGQTYEGFLAVPDGGPAPLVLVCHAWGGVGDNERSKAERLAAAGYAAFALDVYGKGKRGATPEECQALMNPLVGNRAELQKRLNAGIVFSKTLPGVLQGKRAAVGFCFGGLCVLDMARAGMDVQGVAPFHGLFGAPDNIAKPANTAKVHIFHGYDDPMATPDDMVGVMNELTKAGADWQLTAYGNTKHSFTTEAANRPDMGMDYSADADRRSWGALMQFLGEILR